MNYQQSLDYLKALGNEVLTMKFGLETVSELLRSMGDPHRDYASVLIAGTNGKGSVAFFLDSILRAAGLRTGLYTSPQLQRYEERIAVQGRPVSEEEFAGALTRVAEAIQRASLACHPTVFEILTAAAFDHFSRSGIRLAVLEVGMGGRLDSTNVVTPEVSVLAPIALDHQRHLGGTVEEIAAEKAGILRPEVPVISAPQSEAAWGVIRQRASALNSPLASLEPSEFSALKSNEGCYSFRYRGLPIQLRVHGRHQTQNAALAAEAAYALRSSGWDLPEAAIRQGLETAFVPGRIEKLTERPALFVDVAHNPHAAGRLAEFVEEHTAAPRALIFSMLSDKDIRGTAEALRPWFEMVWLTLSPSPRAASMEDLLKAFPTAKVAQDLSQAWEEAKGKAATVVVAGSFTIAGQFMGRFRRVS